jgi:hypothetical protein
MDHVHKLNVTFKFLASKFLHDKDPGRIRRCAGRQGRREGTMSISVGHRAIASAFGWGQGPARRPAGAPSPATTTTAAQSSVQAAAVEPGELVCSPWEGLYREQAHPVTARGKEATTRQQLDSFLNSLMYGE